MVYIACTCICHTGIYGAYSVYMYMSYNLYRLCIVYVIHNIWCASRIHVYVIQVYMVYIACTCICHTMYIAFTLCMSYKIYTTHRQHIYNTYTTHIQHIYNAYRTHIQHICNTYITHIQHIYHTYITHTQHIYRIHMYTSYNMETDIWKMRDL